VDVRTYQHGSDVGQAGRSGFSPERPVRVRRYTVRELPARVFRDAWTQVRWRASGPAVGFVNQR